MINSLGGSTATYQLQRNKLRVLGWLGDGQTDGRMDGDVMPVWDAAFGRAEHRVGFLEQLPAEIERRKAAEGFLYTGSRSLGIPVRV